MPIIIVPSAATAKINMWNAKVGQLASHVHSPHCRMHHLCSSGVCSAGGFHVRPDRPLHKTVLMQDTF